MQPNLFFESSKTFSKQIVDIYDFIWPTSVALWNLRWQVKGMVAEIPDIDHDVLLGRFVGGSTIRGVNLKKSCIDTKWEEQANQLAKIMLSEFCALYEAWYKDFNDELTNPLKKSEVKSFEYLSIVNHVSSLQKCSGLESSIYPKLRRHKKYTGQIVENPQGSKEIIFSKKSLESLIHTYRYFKEIRNCNIHHGGFPTENAKNSYGNFKSITTTELLAKEIPEHPIPDEGQKLNLTLRGVVGLGDIVLKLIATLDAEFASTAQAHNHLKAKWKDKVGPTQTLPSDKKESQNKVEGMFRKMHIAAPNVSDDLLILLRQLKLVSLF